MATTSKEASKEFARLDRHIRTSATITELAHWDSQRQTARVTRTEAKVLEELVLDRVQLLMREKFGRRIAR